MKCRLDLFLLRLLLVILLFPRCFSLHEVQWIPVNHVERFTMVASNITFCIRPDWHTASSAWSECKVKINSSEPLVFTIEKKMGWTCRSVNYILGNEGMPRMYAPNFLLSAYWGIRDCIVKYCDSETNKEIGRTSEKVTVVSSNFYYRPCLTISKSKAGSFLSSKEGVFASVVFSTRPSWNYPRNLLFGLITIVHAADISKQRISYYILGAISGITFSIALGVYLLVQQLQRAVSSVPGAGMVRSISTTATLFNYAGYGTGFLLFPFFSVYIKELFSYAAGFLLEFWSNENIFGIPHLGKLYFLFFGLCGCISVWWFEIGASVKAMPDSDGIDFNDEAYDTPLTTTQHKMFLSAKAFGCYLLLQSTSSLELSVGILLLSLGFTYWQSIFRYAYFWYYYEKPGRSTPLLSKSEYEQQSAESTNAAIKALRQHLKENPAAIDSLQAENEIYVQRFLRGKSHLQSVEAEYLDGDKHEGIINTGNSNKESSLKTSLASAQLRISKKIKSKASFSA